MFELAQRLCRGETQINMLRYEGHLMFIKDIKTRHCGKCRHCFKQPSNFGRHVKTCNGGEINYIWSGSVYEPKNIKQSLAAFGIDVSKHDFLFPYLAVYDMEASLPNPILQPAVKHAKTCNDVNGI